MDKKLSQEGQLETLRIDRCIRLAYVWRDWFFYTGQDFQKLRRATLRTCVIGNGLLLGLLRVDHPYEVAIWLGKGDRRTRGEFVDRAIRGRIRDMAYRSDSDIVDYGSLAQELCAGA